jgi:hypothetical protein
MTRDQFIWLIKTDYNAGDATPAGNKNLHEGDLLRHCEMGFSNLVEVLYRQSMEYNDMGQLDPMIKIYLNQEVMYDNERCEHFIQLPVSIVQLPNNAGVRMVFSAKNQSLPFMYGANNTLPVYNAIEMFDGQLSERGSFYVERDKVFVDFNGDESYSLSLKLIPDFTGYDGDDELPIVFGKDGVMYDVVMNRLRGRNKIHDDYNDNNSKNLNR